MSFLKSPTDSHFSTRQYSMINQYLLPISLIFSLETPVFRLYQELGITEYEKPRTITLSGNSTVRLKWGLSKGSSPKRVDLRYNLNALVTSL